MKDVTLNGSQKIMWQNWQSRIPFHARKKIKRAWLVGSRARQTANKLSDVDLILEPQDTSALALVRFMTSSLVPGDRVQLLCDYKTGRSQPKIVVTHFIVVSPGEEKHFPERIRLKL